MQHIQDETSPRFFLMEKNWQDPKMLFFVLSQLTHLRPVGITVVHVASPRGLRKEQHAGSCLHPPFGVPESQGVFVLGIFGRWIYSNLHQYFSE